VRSLEGSRDALHCGGRRADGDDAVAGDKHHPAVVGGVVTASKTRAR
jgi:hypothetical protein